MELDTGVPGLCARAQHDPELAFPTFALAMTVFDNAAWDAMSPERPLAALAADRDRPSRRSSR